MEIQIPRPVNYMLVYDRKIRDMESIREDTAHIISRILR
jgi:hypothetical protein